MAGWQGRPILWCEEVTAPAGPKPEASGPAPPGGVAIVEPRGAITTKASVEFERDLLKRLADGSRLFVIDFSSVELITSAAIRVLLMLGQRLPPIGGSLVLCAMSAEVQTVFDVAGLKPQFRMASTRDDAVAQVMATASGEPSTTVGRSKLTRQVARLLAVTTPGAAPSPAPVAAGTSALTREVARLLAASPARPGSS
jgi:anti-anti-sigma factor